MDFLTQVVEGTVEGIKKSKGHSMKLRSGRRSANAADFEHFDVDYEWVDEHDEWAGVKGCGMRLLLIGLQIELDYEDFDHIYGKYDFDNEGDKNWP
ncbi:unnamed protein product [Prunus armeniaca]|uniref:Uncharacterized protein n=1 Tax=Prunus armeniaca TaxID=36596 RepID=A0A6J5WUE0_PRUAR|nr:unnamed protein product [Prunus armeniaca]